MIRHLKHTEIDKGKWDETIHASTNGFIYALSWYLDAVSPGWEALVKGDYAEVMPLTQKQKFFLNYLLPPYSTQQLGVFSISKTEAFDVSDFINAIPKKYKWIDIRLNFLNQLRDYKKECSLFVNYELGLGGNYESIASGYSENTKRNLKRASALNLKIYEAEKAIEVVELFKKNKGATLSRLGEDYYNCFLKVFQECRKRGLAEVFHAKENGEIIAGAVFFKFKNRSILILTGANEQAKQSRAMFYLIGHYIRLNAQSGLVLDFEGSNNEQLARFYKGFGAVNVPYPALKANRLPFWLKWLK